MSTNPKRLGQAEELWQAPVADIVTACCSAPYFFPPRSFRSDSGKQERVYCDGGITGLNNPSVLGVSLVAKQLRHEGRMADVLSFGSGEFTPLHTTDDIRNRFVLANALQTINALMKSSSDLMDQFYEAFAHSLPIRKYLRTNHERLPSSQLDDWRSISKLEAKFNKRAVYYCLSSKEGETIVDSGRQAALPETLDGVWRDGFVLSPASENATIHTPEGIDEFFSEDVGESVALRHEDQQALHLSDELLPSWHLRWSLVGWPAFCLFAILVILCLLYDVFPSSIQALTWLTVCIGIVAIVFVTLHAVRKHSQRTAGGERVLETKAISASRAEHLNRVYLVSFPNVVFMYPSFMMALIAGLALIFGVHPITMVAAQLFWIILVSNLFALALSWSQATSVTLYFAIVATLAIIWVTLSYRPELMPSLATLLAGIRPIDHWAFYLLTAAVLGLSFVIVMIWVRGDYWEIRDRELLHHHRGKIDRKRCEYGVLIKATQPCFYRYILLRSGTVTIYRRDEQSQPTTPPVLQLKNVLAVDEKEKAVLRLLGH